MSNQLISLLYDAVLRNDVCSNAVTEADIISAIENMTKVYKPRLNSLSSTEKYLADYNTVAHRCAYLHKYAAFHTAIVRDVLVTVLNQDMNFFSSLYHKLTTSVLKICSLGGGPGSDIVGIVAALSQIASFQCSAKVVDLKADWERTLWSVVHELRCRDYGLVGECFQVENFHFEYLMADLLENEVEYDVTAAIRDADWVTMVKFVSAASCKSTENMLMKIFRILKPGSMVLFIDNASGGFSELVSTVSKKCNMRYVFGPINHKIYTNEDLRRSLCGYTSCFSTTLTIHLMEKQSRNRESNFKLDQAGWVREMHSTVGRAEWSTDSDFTIDQSGWVSQKRPIAQLRWLRESNTIESQAVWMSDTSLIPKSRWLKEPYPIEAKAGWNRASNYIIDQASGISETSLVPKSRWMKEPIPVEFQEGWSRDSDYTIDQSAWFSESSLVPQTRWVNASHPIEAQTGWNTDFNAGRSEWISEAHPIAQSQRDRDSEPLLPLPVWDREPQPLLPLPAWGRQLNFPVNWVRDSNPMVAQSVWDIGGCVDTNSIQTRLNIKQNPIVPPSRWNRGKISHCGSIMRQQNKFKSSRSINISRKMKFRNNSIQMKQRIKSHMRL